MKNAARITTAIAILTTALSGQSAAADAQGPEQTLTYDVTVTGATVEQQVLVDTAIDRYRQAGLPIPSISITFHTDTDGCRGYLGYYDQTQRTVDMCNWGQHYKITPASTLLHELAHAWSFDFMTMEDRGEFTEHRGLDSWHHDGIWWHMGQEQAAEIVAWAVGGDDFVSVYLTKDTCDELSDAYEIMTGSHPTDDCSHEGHDH